MKDTRNKIHLGEVKILNIFSIFLVWTFLRTTQSGILSHLTVFFLNAIPVFCHAAFTVPFGRAFFNSYSLYPLPILASGDATGLRGTFPDHPRPFHLTFTTYTTTFIHPWAPFPTGLEPVLILPSTTLPSAPRRHTHTSMARRRFLPWKKILPLRRDSNPLASGPRPRSTFSDSHAATEPPTFNSSLLINDFSVLYTKQEENSRTVIIFNIHCFATKQLHTYMILINIFVLHLRT
jgi:hypothetical protein